MSLKELIEEVERLSNRTYDYDADNEHNIKLQGIKQTVEAVEFPMDLFLNGEVMIQSEMREDWQKLKKLLGVK